MLKALTVRQPWAIIHAGKVVENRTWYTHFRGLVAIHTAKPYRRARYDDDIETLMNRGVRRKDVPLYEAIVTSAIIGVVDIVDCVDKHHSKWFHGPYGFVVANTRPIKPIACAGALGFWTVPPAIERRIKRLVRLA